MNYKTELDLQKHTRLLDKKQDQLIPKNCKARCIRSTIINRAYYSTFLYVKKYLKQKKLKIQEPKYYIRNHKKVITEHQQVINLLAEENEDISEELKLLKKMRNKSDYHPEKKLTIEDVNMSINYMNNIIKELKTKK